ncbi:Zn-ribbon domain-containing OB-fold protein [Streptomyces albipurpureus]|uniref:OB-fold domain-containing protein n=1 Tax=Streptomyces albipurpureus TaxID=2897419 RepID=A0ABT0UG17_9ACTN|nr:OB-fold domain-containing protein [Streptomyces sp. CWNU-1]MCM2387582.1 OB-fold domain-containing protein [Streptomyces sp. CWNU-1]
MDKPLPLPTPVSQPFWDGLREHRMRIQYSPSGDRWVFYPRLLAPGSLADDLEWREVSGAAALYSFAVARVPSAAAWSDSPPQLPAIVELAEGPRLTTELVNVDPAAITIGMPLRPVFYDVPDGNITLLRYEPA